MNPARALGDGGGDHARAMASFLTGRHPRKTDGADLRAGVSVDQAAAQRIGQCDPVPVAGDRLRGGQECAANATTVTVVLISPTFRGAAKPRPSPSRSIPAWSSIGSSAARLDRDGGEDLARSDRHNKSILDFVGEDARQLSQTLGAADRRKLDEYLTGVRELEQRIARARPAVDLGVAKYPRPLGIPADYQEHLRLMGDLLVLAFQCDLTRIVTFVFANDGSNRSYRTVGVSDGHHDLSHHGGDTAKQEKIQKINQFHTAQLAYILQKLKSIPEGDGTLLDHCMILYGSGISDGNAHSHDDLPILLAGKANGTIKTGRHVRLPRETPLTNLYVSMLDRMGVKVDGFGDSTGRLTRSKAERRGLATTQSLLGFTDRIPPMPPPMPPMPMAPPPIGPSRRPPETKRGWGRSRAYSRRNS